jgi:hypothetical protein
MKKKEALYLIGFFVICIYAIFREVLSVQGLNQSPFGKIALFLLFGLIIILIKQKFNDAQK